MCHFFLTFAAWLAKRRASLLRSGLDWEPQCADRHTPLAGADIHAVPHAHDEDEEGGGREGGRGGKGGGGLAFKPVHAAGCRLPGKA